MDGRLSGVDVVDLEGRARAAGPRSSGRVVGTRARTREVKAKGTHGVELDLLVLLLANGRTEGMRA